MCRFLLTIGQQTTRWTETCSQEKEAPIDQRFKKCLSISAFTFFSEMCPQYITKTYKTFIQNNIVARNSSSNLFKTLRTKTLTQKSLFYFRDTHLEWFTR